MKLYYSPGACSLSPHIVLRESGLPFTPVMASTKTHKLADGTDVCRYPQYRETLPGGRTYNVLDLGPRPQDDTPPVVVPEGALFLMGDNRDNSEDSRFADVDFVPLKLVKGKAAVSFWPFDKARIMP